MSKPVGRGHRRDCGCVQCRPDASRIFMERCKCGHTLKGHSDGGGKCETAIVNFDKGTMTVCGCKTFRQE